MNASTRKDPDISHMVTRLKPPAQRVTMLGMAGHAVLLGFVCGLVGFAGYFVWCAIRIWGL